MRVFSLALCVVLLATVSVATAQSVGVGVKAGVNLANVNFEGENADVKLENRIGLVAGGFVTWRLAGRFAVQPEVLFSMKGGIDSIPDGGDVKIELDYLDLPLLGRYNVIARRTRSIYVFGGPSLGLRLRARTSAEFGDISEIQNVSKDIERFDFGAVAGAGVEIGRIVIDGRFAWGLSDIDKDKTDKVEARNRVVSILGGFRF